MHNIFFFFFLLLSIHANSQIPNPQIIDIQHYRFALTLSDKDDVIKGEATLRINFLRNSDKFHLDLVSPNKNSGKGMKVEKVLENTTAIDFQQKGDSLLILSPVEVGKTRNLTIHYQGIPADGLIVSKNKYGDRTFFGDNWPNRAHHYLPCVDHPADKATVEFIVEAPSHYQVVANGTLVEETNLPDALTRHHWKCDVPLPTKVMVIGAARFAVQHIGEVEGTPVSLWVYPQNRVEGFYDYAMAKDILAYFIQKIGPYPYSKLANVQSKTRFGGMENAGNIFYSEYSVTGKRTAEDLIAHEIVHQWFGNSASESDWPHLWLSEGFATYLTDMYIEETRGVVDFQTILQKQREQVIAFYQKKQTPVVDTITQDLMEMLNDNAYQKGAWVLHMLRREVGDSLFLEGVRAYHRKYTLSNANTDDFQKVMESVSNKDLSIFFNQWLRTAGQPLVEVNASYKKGELLLKIKQKQASGFVFQFPLEIKLVNADKTEVFKTLQITDLTHEFTMELSEKPIEIILDPHVNLLYVGKLMYK